MMAADMARTSPRTYRIRPVFGTCQTFTRTPMTSGSAARIWEEAAKRPTAPAPPTAVRCAPDSSSGAHLMLSGGLSDCRDAEIPWRRIRLR